MTDYPRGAKNNSWNNKYNMYKYKSSKINDKINEKSKGRSCPAPEVGSIQKGTVTRIESYGAFVKLQYPYRGLVHISQLSSCKIEKVEDAVSMDDVLYVKILECREEVVEEEEGGEEGRNPMRGARKRHRIRMSAKYASQDGQYTDLDPTGEQAAREASFRRDDKAGGDGGRKGYGAIPSALEQTLNSTIGMGVAIDPLAAMHQAAGAAAAVNSAHGRLVLRGGHEKNQVLINGYALVDDHEGEVPLLQTAASTSMSALPMGRGRGATLPAWMTRTSPDGPTGERSPTTNLSQDSSNFDAADDTSIKSISSSSSVANSRTHSRHRNTKDRRKGRRSSSRRHRRHRNHKNRHSKSGSKMKRHASKISSRMDRKSRKCYDDDSTVSDNHMQKEEEDLDNEKSKHRHKKSSRKRQRKREYYYSSDDSNDYVSKDEYHQNKSITHKSSTKYERREMKHGDHHESRQNIKNITKASLNKYSSKHHKSTADENNISGGTFTSVEEAKALILKLEKKIDQDRDD